MADEEFGRTVLCEAMEYLTKLASNLGARTVSMKEKRINRSKLRDSEAVKNAAEKVLLLCQLSKKSLENVEKSVKEMLGDGTGDGGKSGALDNNVSHTSSTNKARSHSSNYKKLTISGKKYVLKMPKNVNVKHFMSVKVSAKSISKSMLDKYPIYQDCKLYRERRRRERNAIKVESKSNASNELSTRYSSDQIPSNEKEERSVTKAAKTNVVDNSLSEDCKMPSRTKSTDQEENSKCKSESLHSGTDEKMEQKKLSKRQKKSKVQESDCSDNSQASNDDHKTEEKQPDPSVIELDSGSESNLQLMQNNSTKANNVCLSETRENEGHSDSDSTKSVRKSKTFKKKKKALSDSDHEDLDKQRKNSVIELDSENENNQLSKSRKKEKDNETHSGNSDSNSLESTRKSSKTSNRKKSKQLDTSDSEQGDKTDSKSLSHKESTKSIGESKTEDNNKESEGSVIGFHSDNENKTQNSQVEVSDKVNKEELNELGGDDKNGRNDENEETENAKPLIKLVNIKKLLKPEIANKQEKCTEGSNSKLVVRMNKKCEIKEYLIRDDAVKPKHKTNETIKQKLKLKEIINQKSEEVRHFRPKKFVIKVCRLSSPFTVDFLYKEHLRRIIHNGKTLCEVPNEGNDANNRTAHEFTQPAEINQPLDNTLPLAENESLTICNKESCSESLKYENEKVKKSLLNDSESDQSERNENEENASVNCAIINSKQDTLAEFSHSSKEKNIDKLSSKPQNKDSEKELPAGNDSLDKDAKSALLNDSSDGNTSQSNKNLKNSDRDKKSRRKHIMESMHAKKMLLTYSSSSDTEDEQLRNVIKGIKDSLLKETVSDEEKPMKSPAKKSSTSSSEEDVVTPAKKKRKVSESESQSKLDLDNSNGGDQNEKENGSNASSKKSNSACKKMGRTRENGHGSGSHNSDTQDDKEIEGLTNLESLKNSRRGGSVSERAGGSRRKMSRTPHIRGEPGLLEAPSSSDNEPSGGDSDVAEEDLPPVSMSNLNGSTLEYLAKDDLLGESESDSSKDKSSDQVKKESDSEAEHVKAKRRKANAIASSDSEAGSSRRKQQAAAGRVSDFEDSGEESSEPFKKNKRKKESDSDASAGSSTEGKKKRRRIKQIDSDGSGSDTENEGKSKHGRKNIRKVMGKNQLEEATKKAAREEKERVARIAERQKMYNNLEFDESGKPDEVILDKVVLDFDPETKEPLIEVDRGLVKKLKPHQANGIKFMWDACFESVKRIKKDRGSGCILAHCMGLGKTLQVVSLTHTLLTHSELTGVNRVLVVCPLSTVLNWVNEFTMWLKHAETDYDVDVYELSRHKQNTERAFQLSQWFLHGGVCVLGYEMFRNLSADNGKKFKKKMLRQLQEALVDPGPDLVVCDEGHLLKNEKTSLSQSMNRVRTRRRIVLTGTPLQNNLKEYYCMVQFVKPNLLGKYNEYLNRFVNPITNGQYTDSTEHDIRVMKRRSHVLHKMLDGAVQRRDYGVLAPFLPPKHEYVLFITLTDLQVKLYQHYLENYSRRPLPGKSSGFLFPDFQSLQRIWTHPLVLKYNSERYEIMQQKKREREEEDSEGSLVDFIDDDSTPEETSSEEESDSLSDMSDDSRKKSKKKKSNKKGKKDKESKGGARRGTRANPVELEDDTPLELPEEVRSENPTEWWIPLVTDAELDDVRNSRKLVLLFEILRQCEAIGDKLLVFSQSLYSLDLIEHFLGKVDEATQAGRVEPTLGGHVGSWAPGVDYFRLDGSTSCENRSIWCKNFNREDNPRARLFLISTRAGGLGINLVAANRVVIFDVSWNPSHDVQSIFRVYRFGQKKPCYIYRFLAMGTMEEKIYERQVTKQAISKRVIDEQQIDRHYAEHDLTELYKFEPSPPAPRPVPLVPKDRLFAEMLKEHEDAIYKFHEHDSLLENKEEETLSEEERKAAWEDFENEKNRPPPAPFPSWPMHNGMMSGMLAQQQQLAYAAVAAMLRKDMPNLTDDNIRSMLPLIYAANPAMFGGYDYGLMQKVQEMTYKYSGGMMNPAMNMNMNPMMNAGTGGVGGPGAGAGGMASALQYEPPWQRQQQQQQQLRLQQLMQHQNQMGAKLYAGGLGSRDPVAMALQQQRAREIMLGGAGAGSGAAGRPRGRPPHAPLARPLAAPTDIVNLDSD